MMEQNTFRTMMLLGGIITLGITMTSLFVAPLIEADESTQESYQLVMGKEMGVGTHHEDHLTIFEALLFSIEGKSRGNVRHY